MKKAWASRKNSNQSGFTVVELIVVIIVIAIIVTIVSVVYGGVQRGVRDNTRTSDITRLKLAIERYHADNSEYPPCVSSGSCYAIELGPALSPYIDAIPVDPTATTPGTGNDYKYVRSAVTSDNYGVMIYYEGRPGCKTGVNITASWWSSAPTCTHF